MKTTYISVDIETNGLIPGKHALLEIGAVDVTDPESVFHCKVRADPNTQPDPETVKWWRHPLRVKHWKYLNDPEGAVPVDMAVDSFLRWVDSYSNPVLCAWHSPFDFGFIRYYADEEHQRKLLKETIDIPSYIAGVEGCHVRQVDSAAWLEDRKLHIVHEAVEDARVQARAFLEAMNRAFSKKRFVNASQIMKHYGATKEPK